MVMCETSQGHSGGEDASDDLGDSRHAGIGIFLGSHQSSTRPVHRICPRLRSPTRDERDDRHHLSQALEVAHAGGLCSNALEC
jgi:hypothetical protein